MLSPSADGRLSIVSNRLPVCINQTGKNGYECTPASGGLVSGLSGLAKGGLDFTWYGWPGIEIPKEDTGYMRELLLREHDAVPVLLDQQLAKGYYDGFSNSTIWPIFHHQHDLMSHDADTRAAYHKANEIFAETVAADLQDGDCIWIHDYHLMLLPLLLRQRAEKMRIKIRIGWFLHTHFPEEDIFALLPSGLDILNGIVGADLVGFQTREAHGNFLKTLQKVLPYRVSNGDVICCEREVSANIFPIGIHPSDFQGRLQKDSVQEQVRSMRQRAPVPKIIVGVDRLDIIKGVPQKLRAFQELLERYPEWVGNVTLVQLVIPSRGDLEMSKKLRSEMQHIAKSINCTFGNMGYTPVDLLYRSMDPEELTALYAAADVCFISSLRDGMNLVSYEYVACHSQRAVPRFHGNTSHGALVLSKFAGAADILDGSILVDPWDQDDCADALAYALTMSEDEAHERMRSLGARVEKYTSLNWGNGFLDALKRDSRRDSIIDLAAAGLQSNTF